MLGLCESPPHNNCFSICGSSKWLIFSNSVCHQIRVSECWQFAKLLLPFVLRAGSRHHAACLVLLAELCLYWWQTQRGKLSHALRKTSSLIESRDPHFCCCHIITKSRIDSRHSCLVINKLRCFMHQSFTFSSANSDERKLMMWTSSTLMHFLALMIQFNIRRKLAVPMHELANRRTRKQDV